MPTCDSSDSLLRRVYVLAGGKSSRFGTNKALVEIDREPQLLRLAKQLRSDSWQTVAVAQKAGQFDWLGIRTIGDIQPDQGPLAGILAGLIDLQSAAQADSHNGFDRSNRSAWALFITCDLWQWDRVWSDLLIPASLESETTLMGLRYFSAEPASKGFMPFPCVVHLGATRNIQKEYDSGCRSMRDLLLKSQGLAQGVSLGGNSPPKSFNTPEELRALQETSR